MLLVAACSSISPLPEPASQPKHIPRDLEKGREVVLYSMGLIGIDYRFGGKNPESGLDCSGMVSYIYEKALGIKLPHHAAQIARLGQEIEMTQIAPGDLVFFNTQNRPFSHVGIYIGDDRFIHAPNSNGKIRISNLKSGYYAQHLQAIRAFF